MDIDIESLKARIAQFKAEHRDLDVAIIALEHGRGAINPLELQRLKRRKLALKDLIGRLESQLLPDIIA